MNKYDDDKKTYFLLFCIEQYKNAKNLDGETVKSFFDKNGITEFLVNNYDVLHTQGYQWILEEIEDFIKVHGKPE